MKRKFVILDIIYFIAFILVCVIVFLLIKDFSVEKKELGIDFSKKVLLKQQDNCLLYKFDDDSSSDNNTFNSQKNIIKNDRDSDDSNEDGWIKLYDLDELRNETNNGTDSDSNVEKEFEFRVFENVIQWSFLGENNWNDLISVFDIISTQNDDNDETQLDIDETTVNNIVVAVNNNINNLGCYNNGTECEKGTLFTIKVNKDNVYNFYVIADDGENISLIMDSNIVDSNIKTLPYADEDSNNPIYSINLLNYLTSKWNFIDYIDDYSYSDDFGNSFTIENGIGKFVDENGSEFIADGLLRTRFLDVNEAFALGCRDSNFIARCNEMRCINDYECPYWLHKNLNGKINSLYPSGYWLLGTTSSNSEMGAYAMLKDGNYSFSSFYDNISFGVRPVISIRRSE